MKWKRNKEKMKNKSGLNKCRILPFFLAALLLTGCGSVSDFYEELSNIMEMKEEDGDTEQSSLIEKLETEKLETEKPETDEMEPDGFEKPEKTAKPEEGTSQELQEIEENKVEEGKSSLSREELEEKRDAAGLSRENIAALKQKQAGNYYYNLCNDKEQTLYAEIFQILSSQGAELLISTTDADQLPKVYQCVINDHPELFYLNGYTYTKYTKKEEVQYITFSGRYLYTPEEVKERQSRIDVVIAENYDRLKGADDYGTVKAVYEYLILETDYSMDSPDNQNICSVLLDHRSVCNGYAKAAQYLLARFGIPCIIVNGNAGGAHAWNIVEIDGAYYHMDTTWGDPSYHSPEGDGYSITPDIDYSYLCVTTEEISKNHSIDEKFPVPQCTALKDNYFVREGLYLDGYQEETIKTIFDSAEAAGKKSVTIKASSRQAYDELYDNLIKKQKIFDYFGSYNAEGEFSIAYSENEELCTINFWS